MSRSTRRPVVTGFQVSTDGFVTNDDQIGFDDTILNLANFRNITGDNLKAHDLFTALGSLTSQIGNLSPQARQFLGRLLGVPHQGQSQRKDHWTRAVEVNIDPNTRAQTSLLGDTTGISYTSPFLSGWGNGAHDAWDTIVLGKFSQTLGASKRILEYTKRVTANSAETWWATEAASKFVLRLGADTPLGTTGVNTTNKKTRVKPTMFPAIHGQAADNTVDDSFIVTAGDIVIVETIDPHPSDTTNRLSFIVWLARPDNAANPTRYSWFYSNDVVMTQGRNDFSLHKLEIHSQSKLSRLGIAAHDGYEGHSQLVHDFLGHENESVMMGAIRVGLTNTVLTFDNTFYARDFKIVNQDGSFTSIVNAGKYIQIPTGNAYATPDGNAFSTYHDNIADSADIAVTLPDITTLEFNEWVRYVRETDSDDTGDMVLNVKAANSNTRIIGPGIQAGNSITLGAGGEDQLNSIKFIKVNHGGNINWLAIKENVDLSNISSGGAGTIINTLICTVTARAGTSGSASTSKIFDAALPSGSNLRSAKKAFIKWNTGGALAASSNQGRESISPLYLPYILLGSTNTNINNDAHWINCDNGGRGASSAALQVLKLDGGTPAAGLTTLTFRVNDWSNGTAIDLTNATVDNVRLESY